MNQEYHYHITQTELAEQYSIPALAKQHEALFGGGMSHFWVFSKRWWWSSRSKISIHSLSHLCEFY